MEKIFQYLFELKELLSNHTLFTIGILLIFGYLLGKLAGKIKLPEITGYIISLSLLWGFILSRDVSKPTNLLMEQGFIVTVFVNGNISPPF